MKLQIRIDTETVLVEPFAVDGLGLRCKVPAGPERIATQIFVHDFQVSDQLAFWAAWESLGGKQQGLAWENGDPYCPPVQVPQTRPRRSWWLVRWLRWLANWFEGEV